MEIKDIQPNTGNIDLVLKVVEKEDPRSFEKFGKEGRVCNIKVSDDTGDVKLTLWNDDVDSVNVGDKIHLQNGWCSEYRGEKQLSSGKFGKIEIVEAASKEVFTNSAEMLGQQTGGVAENGAESEGEEGVELIKDEEVVE
jgi:replication factor A1